MNGHSLIAAAALPLLVAAALPSVAAMRHHRRVLIVAAPSARDPGLLAQRWALAGWRGGAADRDLTLVELIGEAVSGVDDRAATLRATWRLPAQRFTVVLVGKDGHQALRRSTPVTAADLQQLIDAMPMRRAGER